MIVLDASAAVQGLLHDGEARGLLADESICVPHHTDLEIANALRRLVRSRAVDDETATAALVRWARLGVQRLGVTDLLGAVWSRRDNLSAYDAGYVALAEATGCPVVTADRRLARAPTLRCPVRVVVS